MRQSILVRNRTIGEKESKRTKQTTEDEQKCSLPAQYGFKAQIRVNKEVDSEEVVLEWPSLSSRLNPIENPWKVWSIRAPPCFLFICIHVHQRKEKYSSFSGCWCHSKELAMMWYDTPVAVRLNGQNTFSPHCTLTCLKNCQYYFKLKENLFVYFFRFLLQCLDDLDSSLRKLNSRLFVIRGQPANVFPRLFKVKFVHYTSCLIFLINYSLN